MKMIIGLAGDFVSFPRLRLNERLEAGHAANARRSAAAMNSSHDVTTLPVIW